MATVLILEDDDSLRFVFAEALKDAGHRVQEAKDAAEATALMRRTTPDVLLLDLMVGQSFATDVANYASLTAPHAKVIYVTGSGLFPKGELFDFCRNTQFVLRKPVDLGELTDTVGHVAIHARNGRARSLQKVG